MSIYSLRGMAVSALVSTSLLGACAAEVGPPIDDDREVALQTAAIFPRISGCSSEDYNRVRAMVDSAEDYILYAQDDLESIQNGGSTSRFDYWFGGHDPEFVGIVAEAFGKMLPWLWDVQFQCGCPGADPSVIARATPGDPSKPVQLCEPALSWDFTEFGAGAIIHEFSHIAGTLDWFKCSVPGSFDWPEEFHRAAASSWPLATNSAEHFRLYALGWHANQASSASCL
jgi:hypothetical protein